MTKTFAQVVYSDLTPEQFAAVESHLANNGINYEVSSSDETWVRALDVPAAAQTGMETAVFGAPVPS